MIDSNKRDRFFSAFSDFERDILTGYINTISSSKADVYLIMARKATCLIEALVELGGLSLNGKVYSERILDLNKEFLLTIFKNKSVIVIDDTIVSGTTISDVVKTLLDYGASHVSIEVITVNKKWYAPNLIKARLQSNGGHGQKVSYSKPVELLDNDSIKFCFDIVKGLSIIPKLYDYDFPRVKLQKWKEQVLSSLLINDTGWKYFDCSTPFQKENGIFAYTCIPSEHTVKEFDNTCGTNLSEISNFKIRFLGYKNLNGSYNLTAVPMIIFNAISKDDLNNYFRILCDGSQESIAVNQVFVSHISKLRFLQYAFSIKLIEFWMKHAKEKFAQNHIVSIRNYVDKNVEKMLFTEVGSIFFEKNNLSNKKDYIFKKKSLNLNENVESILPRVNADYIIKARLVEPFLDFYDNKELPCRMAVKQYNYDNFNENEFLECINRQGAEYGRLKHGITFTEFYQRIEYLKGHYDYITFASVFLDKLISRGIAVPIIQEDDSHLYRAYRHGEDAIMGDMEHRIVSWILKSICDEANIQRLQKITTEKLIALFIKFGVRKGWIDSVLDDRQTIEHHKIVISNKHDLHGMRAKATYYNNNEFRKAPWYTYYLITKEYINEPAEGESGYSFNPPVDFDPKEYTKGSSDIVSFSIVFGEIIKKLYVQNTNRDDFNWQLTKLASCIYPKDTLDALITEISIFRQWWDENKYNFNYNNIRETTEYSRAKTAINSGQVKYYAYRNNEAQAIVKEIASSLSDALYSNIFTSFFDLRESESGQKYHESMIDILGCWLVTMNLLIRLLEVSYHLGEYVFTEIGDYNWSQIAINYFDSILENEIESIDKNSFYLHIQNRSDINGKEILFKALSGVFEYVYKVSFFLQGYNIPNHLIQLTRELLRGTHTGEQTKEQLYRIIEELNNRILNQIKRAEWEVENYNKITERRLYRNCIYIKFYQRNPDIVNMIERFLLSSCFQNGNFPYVIKTQDSIFDLENDLCIAFYDNDKNDIKTKIVEFLKRLKPYLDNIERLFTIQNLPDEYAVEVIKNSIDAMPFVHTHNLLDLINGLKEEKHLDDTWFFEIAFNHIQKLRINNIFGNLEFVKETRFNKMEFSEYKKGKPKISQAKIGIVTVLDEEYKAAYNLLQEPYEYCSSTHGAGHTYVIGKMHAANFGYHTVVLCQCSGMGNNMSSIRATQLLMDFKNVKYIFMTGIAAGVPNATDPEKHIRLGDVVISDKTGVIQYDMLKITEERIEHRNTNIAPNARLLEACKKLRRDCDGRFEDIIYSERPDNTTDVLHDEQKNIIPHPIQKNREIDKPCLFIGNIGSANILLKHRKYRDEIVSKFNIRAFEMEGSGIADATWQGEVGYLVVRGISDYGDSFKNDIWHEYAASAAASVTGAILRQITV